MSVLAIIPARGGSKAIPGKNLVDLNGRPLIDYTLAAAKASINIDQIFISTDDNSIADYCVSKNIRVPYQRPQHLATDSSSMIDVIIDVLDWLKENKNTCPDKVVLLQPTSPLRTSQDIDDGLSLMKSSNLDSLISVHSMSERPEECIRKQNGAWQYLTEVTNRIIQRQDYIGNYYFINGAIYAFTPSFIRNHQSLTQPGSQTALYEMPSYRGIDIDTFEDLYKAEAYLSHSKLCPNT